MMASGTFLVRGGGGSLALDLKARSGVKHMKIYVVSRSEGGDNTSLQGGRGWRAAVQLL